MIANSGRSGRRLPDRVNVTDYTRPLTWQDLKSWSNISMTRTSNTSSSVVMRSLRMDSIALLKTSIF